MIGHTKEPWFINKESIDCPVGKLSIEANGDVFIAQVDDGDAQEANARRIVACVNACRGIRTEALEHRMHLLAAEDDTISVLMAQRDQLEQWLSRLERLTGIYIPRGPGGASRRTP